MAETCVAGDAGAGVRRGSSGDSAPVPQPRLWAGRPLPRPSAQAPAPSRPCPQDNEAFHSQTKGKSLKGESSVSTRAKGLGWGRTGLPESHCGCSDEPVWIYSCLTQHNLIFHIKDQIIFQLQLITHPKSTSKDGRRPPSTCFAAPRAPGFHARLRGVWGPGTPPFTPTWAFEAGPGDQGASWALRLLAGPPGPILGSQTVLFPVDAWSPRQNSSPDGWVSLGPTLPPMRNTPHTTITHSLSGLGKGARWAPLSPFIRCSN